LNIGASLSDFADRTDLPEIGKPALQRAGAKPGERVSDDVLVASVVDGSDLHHSLRELAWRGWTEPQLVELMDRSDAKESRPVDWDKRRREIKRLVDSAGKKRAKDAAKVFGAPADAPAMQATVSAPATAPPARKATRSFALTPIDVAKLPRRSWLIYGLLLDGSVTVASAIGGIGKSAWGLRVALAIASGQSWGAWEVKQRRRVLVINAEDGPDELRRRAAANFDDSLNNEHVGDGIVGLESEDIVLVRRGEGYGQSIQRTPLYDELREIIRREGVGFVVVDPLIELSAGLNESDNADMDTLMRALRDVAREFQIPILVIHHAKKGGDGGQDSSRGASAIVNNARVAVTLGPLDTKEATRLPQGNYCKVQIVKSNYAPKGKPHVLEFESLKLANGDLMARVRYVDVEIENDDKALEFEHWPDLLEMVRTGRNGEPWKVSDKAAKADRLDVAMVERWRLPVATARAILDQGVACGRLRQEELPTRYRPKVWRVGEKPDAPLLPWLSRP